MGRGHSFRAAPYMPEYPFHPASYREPLPREPRYSDPYGRQPLGYGAPLPYYRGPPMPPPPPARGYDYPPQGYPSSRPR